jgi:hypothetical protein
MESRISATGLKSVELDELTTNQIIINNEGLQYLHKYNIFLPTMTEGYYNLQEELDNIMISNTTQDLELIQLETRMASAEGSITTLGAGLLLTSGGVILALDLVNQKSWILFFKKPLRSDISSNVYLDFDTNYFTVDRIASAGFSCSGLGTFGWTSVGRWRTRMSRLGSSRGPRLLNRTRCYPKNGHPTRRFLQLLSARKADSDTVPEVALRCSPSATKGNGRHHGLRAGLQSPEANCRQFMCFSPLLHRLPRQAPISAAFDGRRASGPGTTAGSQTASMVLRDLHRSAGDKAGETASWTGLG